jgi:hypothetical protein
VANPTAIMFVPSLLHCSASAAATKFPQPFGVGFSTLILF